jgi:hypothetical protein
MKQLSLCSPPASDSRASASFAHEHATGGIDDDQYIDADCIDADRKAGSEQYAANKNDYPDNIQNAEKKANGQ